MFAGVSSTTRMRALVGESFKLNTSISRRLVQECLGLGKVVVVDMLLELRQCRSVEQGLEFGEIHGQAICRRWIELAKISGHSYYGFANHPRVSFCLGCRWCCHHGCFSQRSAKFVD